MRRSETPRNQHPDLLVRPPLRADGPEHRWAATIDPVAALVELADLFARGLISRPELTRQAAKVVGSGPLGGGGAASEAEPLSCAARRPPPRRATRRPACGRSSSGGT
jgi:hypothetical protein